jgi:hypothetical protein
MNGVATHLCVHVYLQTIYVYVQFTLHTTSLFLFSLFVTGNWQLEGMNDECVVYQFASHQYACAECTGTCNTHSQVSMPLPPILLRNCKPHFPIFTIVLVAFRAGVPFDARTPHFSGAFVLC